MTWQRVLTLVFGEDRLEKIPLKALSLVLLVFALLCAWLPHRQSYLLFWETSVSFTPDFVSGALALAIITPLYARRIIVYPYHSVNSLLFFVVNLALTATFIQITLGKGSVGTFPSLAAIICAVALSWLGMRAAASLAWIGLLAFSVVSMLLSNYAWGMAGFGFIVAGFCGILLQTDMNPSKLLFEILGEYAGRPIPIYQASQVEPSKGEIV